jgi:hypothetical protein
VPPQNCNVLEAVMVNYFYGKLLKLRRKWHKHINEDLYTIMKLVCKPEDELSVLCDIYQSDKGSIHRQVHTYTQEYHKLFYGIRDNIKTVFECGIGTNNPRLASNMGITGQPGASLRVWRDYFKNAVIIGADIDKNILFKENRIYTGYIDQTNAEKIKNFFNCLAPEYPNSFDIMIDDGLHTGDAALCLFENSFQYLNRGGYYVIEDMNDGDISRIEEYFESRGNRNDIIVEYKTMSTIWKPDNNLIIIKKYD